MTFVDCIVIISMNYASIISSGGVKSIGKEKLPQTGLIRGRVWDTPLLVISVVLNQTGGALVISRYWEGQTALKR